MFPPATAAPVACTWRYLHSCSILSSAWARPLSEYWSVDWVRRPEVPFTVKSAPLRMASTMRASSATFLIQAPSFWVYITNLAVPISAVASEVDLNGYPMMTDTSFLTLSAGRVETNRYEGPRGRPAGSNFVVFGLARAKQTLLPPGEAVYAPQSAYCPRSVGWASPAGVAGAAAVAAGLDGVAAGFAAAGGAGEAAGFGGCCAKATDASDVTSINTAYLIALIGLPPGRVPARHAAKREYRELLAEFGNVKANRLSWPRAIIYMARLS